MKQDAVLSNESLSSETVLILQGGGSLGAYECGVYKTLAKHKIKFDIIAGTSIGAINALIIASAKDDSAKILESFWLDIAERVTPIFLPHEIRVNLSAMYAARWGNPKAFAPVTGWLDPLYFANVFPYLYKIDPFKETIQKYIDLENLKSPDRPRVIVTSVDIQKSRSVTFDSKRTSLDIDHVLASAGFPFYGISWTEKDGKYLWDGSLMSNTPLREVINASPKLDKRIYLVSLFPKNHEQLPKNMSESWHRARDIMHTDKTEHNIVMSRIISRYLRLMKEMHEILQGSNLDGSMKSRFEKLEQEYHKLACDRGAIIQEVTSIERQEESHFIFEDADFSIATIKQLIEQGEKDAENVLRGRSEKARQ